MRHLLACLATVALIALAAPAIAASLVERSVRPSAVDPAIKQFDDPDIIVTQRNAPADAPLAIFLPGTGGRPDNTVALLRVIAGQGYRAIGLEYDDTPAVVQVCPRVADATCSADFRAMRIDGTGPGAPGVANPPAEAIVARLVALLRALDKAVPAEGWGGYLDGDRPRWDRIVVSGLSQGAGMAAYIAKQHAVRRVVLFSSPWDFTMPGRRLAPWIGQPSATPPARWFAEYHRRENTADLLALSYRMLQIPADHVLVFDRDVAPNVAARSPNPYHGSTAGNPGYAEQWRTLYGSATAPAG